MLVCPSGSSRRKAARVKIYFEGKTDSIYQKTRCRERRGKGRVKIKHSILDVRLEVSVRNLRGDIW